MIFKVIFGKQIHLINSNDKKKFAQFLAHIPNIFKSLPSRYSISYLDEDGDEITLKDESDYEVLLDANLKTVKVTIRENSEEFMEMTEQLQMEQPQAEVIEEIEEVKVVEEKISHIRLEEQKVEESQAIEESFSPELDDSMIEEKLRKMMPEIISKIKSEIKEEIKEKSKISYKGFENNEPIIIEENEKPQPKVPGVVVHEHVNCDGCGQKGIVGIRYKCAVCSDFDFCERCQATVEHEHPFLKIKTLRQTPVKIFTVINHEDDTSLEINGQSINVPPCLDRMVEHGMNFVEGFLRNQNGGQRRQHPFANMCRRGWGCPQRQEKKEEPKTETKTEEPIKKEQMKAESEPMMEEVSQETIKANANYLLEVFGTPYEAKCLKWAQEHPYMNKEELLNFCISSPTFFE